MKQKPQKWTLEEILKEIDRIGLSLRKEIPEDIFKMIDYARAKKLSWRIITELAAKMGYNASRSFLSNNYKKWKGQNELQKKRNS